jgi:hypothetical protein
MKATLILPVASLRGQLRKDGYYFRMYRGEQIVQSCPRVWHDTPARKARRPSRRICGWYAATSTTRSIKANGQAPTAKVQKKWREICSRHFFLLPLQPFCKSTYRQSSNRK